MVFVTLRSVPTVVGRKGVIDRMEIELWPKEVQGMRASGTTLKKTLDVVLQRLGR